MSKPAIDLDPNVDYRVRIMRLADDANPAGVVYYEGLTRFTLRPLPKLRGMQVKQRYEIVPTAYDLDRGWQFPTNYCVGAVDISDGTYSCVLLDRYREPSAVAVQFAVEATVESFCLAHGLTGVELR